MFRSANGALGYEDTVSRGNGPNEMGEYLPTLDLGSSVRVIQLKSTGRDRSTAMIENSKIKSWGQNDKGEVRGSNLLSFL